MKINWKVRFQNKVWLASFIGMIVSFVYGILGLLDIAPTITQNVVMQIANQLLMILTMLGVIIDPTTEGAEDSDRAMHYDIPWDDNLWKDDVGTM